ncbi:MAG: hypothetical protein A3A80_04375 [Candidatus Terrybacteria bacterium RIFCSPLOWO2_01_FULL_44_24]|uniref:acylphosphatase n=1 Tax=Candidatus Terrybacteria bacterium RIFCSPHIGHO2_01_FULL_43_35 TaxID=1802361 RepID=A0A1G2PC22_9BACT|nr:MAG: hypothetical protein A2828_01250 [Candidatus Terrybacteria bacterium RIFCSPHIGHO2_01_FULL_43_35]OHA49656.1 MAG: hypothetical protein A3B75_01030 [Candidatus Terrybacteria bacterium RIFCSPHIGHO2_02_FULL_43_14]OHA51321.1 MAG: hypothetical protein A3A80_04375 [Candidatus Terrybacteria bacterium RIFCSPLOWO2_01_FULL_44_24]
MSGNTDKNNVSYANIIVSGKVQGVFFRTNGLNMAKQLGLKCIAENQSDGTVYFTVEGRKENIDAFIAWCRKGPPLAQVTNVASFWDLE